MTILFAGGELDGLVPSDSTVVESTVISTGSWQARWDTQYSRTAIYCPNSATYCETPAFSSATTFWYRGSFNANQYPGALTLLSFYSGSTEVFRIRITANSLQMQYLSAASTWTDIGSAFTFTVLNLQALAVKVVPATGVAEAYLANTLRASGTASGGVMSMFSGITKARMWGAGACFWSQILCKTTSTIGRNVSVGYATGNGANTAWTGDYTGIDEIVYSDADGISSGTATQVETYTSSVPTVNGFLVEGVVINARAKCGETGPQNLELCIRTAATNYFSSDHLLTLGYAGYCGIWETDPSTSAAWVTAAAQALEFGVKSIA